MAAGTVAVSLLLLCYLTAGLVAAKQRFNIRSLKATRSLTASGTVGTFSNPKQYTLTVTVGTRSPDCVSRKVILINGQFQPILRFTQGQWVAVTVVNNLPTDWPATTKGISIHWHGFSMKGHAWMDGTRFVSQCPIPSGSSFTYKFQVNEMPGTYFYHDHSSANRADGLQGPLLVDIPSMGVPLSQQNWLLQPYDQNSVLFLNDWWHFPGNSLAMRLNRPFDPSQATNDTGAWCWVGLPKSILINGKGNYNECEDVYKRQVNTTLPFRTDGYVAQPKDLLSPSPCVAGQLGSTAEPSSCGISSTSSQCPRHTLAVVPGQTVRIRMINAAMLVYMTVCFEKHNVQVVALDAAPVAPKTFYQCVDINSGQRVDVLLKADQPLGSYWISVGSQYRKGAPSGYALLRYQGRSKAANASNIIQPGAVANMKWNISQMMDFQPNARVASSTAASDVAAKYYISPYTAIPAVTMPSSQVDKRVVLQSTQPLIEANGYLRWALDNVATATAPQCTPVLDEVYNNTNWASDYALAPNSTDGLNASLYFTPPGGNASTWQGDGKSIQTVDATSSNAHVVLDLRKPGAGTHILSLNAGELVEIVIQNNRAGAYGGEYPSANDPLTNNRAGREQHSFHLHGHHFWQVGMGLGEWSPEKVDGPEYNTVNPILRDTTTVLFNGTTEEKAAWVAFRFVASNAGVWPLHCHIGWHEMMGQGITIVEDAAGIANATVPSGMPACPAECVYTHANFNPNAANALYGDSGLLAPDNANLP